MYQQHVALAVIPVCLGASLLGCDQWSTDPQARAIRAVNEIGGRATRDDLRPGRPLITNIGMAMKLSEIKPDIIHLTSCMATAKPGCPHLDMEEIARMITEKFEIPVVMGTHEYK